MIAESADLLFQLRVLRLKGLVVFSNRFKLLDHSEDLVLQVTEAFKILIADQKVKAILLNIFGGIMKCDIIAQGIINAAKTLKLSVPLVVRLEGTNVERGKQLLKESGLTLIAADNLADAAQKAVKAASAAGSKSQNPNPK